MAKKALLMILDGWGIGKHGKGDVIYNTPTPYLDYLTAVSAHSQLQASGEDVGLPDGQMGNSEVGHLNIGAGRIVYQDLVKINRACKDGSIVENAQVKAAYTYVRCSPVTPAGISTAKPAAVSACAPTRRKASAPARSSVATDPRRLVSGGKSAAACPSDT